MKGRTAGFFAKEAGHSKQDVLPAAKSSVFRALPPLRIYGILLWFQPVAQPSTLNPNPPVPKHRVAWDFRVSFQGLAPWLPALCFRGAQLP